MSGGTEQAPNTNTPTKPVRRRGTRRIIAIPCIVLILWLSGLIWYAEDIPSQVSDRSTPTDAVIVLTGGSARLDVGFDLLARGHATKLFISGVAREVDAEDLIRLHGQNENLRCCVVVGHTATDTAGNARETAQWMSDEGFSSLRLVTASYHMRRSLVEFHRAMPHVTMIPHPVFPQGFRAGDWWRWPGTLHLLISEYSKYLAVVTSQALGIRSILGDGTPRAGSGSPSQRKPPTAPGNNSSVQQPAVQQPAGDLSPANQSAR